MEEVLDHNTGCKTYDIVEFRKSRKYRRTWVVIIGSLIIPVALMLGYIWKPLFFIDLGLMVIAFPQIIGSINSFEKIGKIECHNDYLLIHTDRIQRKINVSDIKGINISVELGNPLIWHNSQAIQYRHRHLAYTIRIVCSLQDRESLTVYNFEESDKRFYSPRKPGFLDELTEYAKMYHIRFWDETGGRSNILG